MSATFAPFGFVPHRHLTGGDIKLSPLKNGIASAYGTSLFRGDPVGLVTGGTIERAAASAAISGVFWGVDFKGADGRWSRQLYWPASQVATEIQVWWYDDPYIVYRAQADATVAQTAIGDATDHQFGTGNVKSGVSAASLDIGLAGAAASAQWKIVDVWDQPGNDWGDAFPVLACIINERNLGRTVGNAI